MLAVFKLAGGSSVVAGLRPAMHMQLVHQAGLRAQGWRRGFWRRWLDSRVRCSSAREFGRSGRDGCLTPEIDASPSPNVAR